MIKSSYCIFRGRAENDGFMKGMSEEFTSENVDYGEFDAIKYSNECTGLYLRDSRRKHAKMKENFVEKTGKSSSESDESFTEYEDPPDKEPPAKGERWKHDKLVTYLFS